MVDRAVHVDRALQAGEVPVPVADAPAAGVVLEPDAAKGVDALLSASELGKARVARLLVGLLPDEEDLVDRAQAVELELVVRVPAGDEELDVVVLVDQRVALGEGSLQKRLLDPVADVKVRVVPEDGGTRVVDARRAADQVGEAG